MVGWLRSRGNSLDDVEADDQFYMLIPTDQKLPTMLVLGRTAPAAFKRNPQGFESKLVACRMIDWKATSRQPLASFHEVVGESFSVPAATRALLMQYQVVDKPHKPESLACLPEDSENWTGISLSFAVIIGRKTNFVFCAISVGQRSCGATRLSLGARVHNRSRHGARSRRCAASCGTWRTEMWKWVCTLPMSLRFCRPVVRSTLRRSSAPPPSISTNAQFQCFRVCFAVRCLNFLSQCSVLCMSRS